MAHFAELDNNNIVQRVIVVNNSDTMKDGVEDEQTGINFCQRLLGGIWKQTSYNGNFRKNYAGMGYTYDSIRDAFISPSPFPSWVLNENTCRWGAPIPMPIEEGKFYVWDEPTITWKEITT